MKQIECRFPLSDDGVNYLAVDAEILDDVSELPVVRVVEINGVSLNGDMSIKLDEIPRKLRDEITEYILQHEI